MRSPSETLLAKISTSFALVNFIWLIWQQISKGLLWQSFVICCLLNSALLFAGRLSLKSRPHAKAQQLAAAWMFTPFVGNESLYGPEVKLETITLFYRSAYSHFIMVSLIFIMTMLIWSITLAVRQSRYEIAEQRNKL
jgi:hypothetical protein